MGIENRERSLLNNDYINVKTYAAYAGGSPLMEGSPTIRYFACKNQDCDRFACTASASRCSLFCCPGCFEGAEHTQACNDNIKGMRVRLVPGAEVIMSDDLQRRRK